MGSCLDEIRRIAGQLRMVGVTLHTQYQGVFIDAKPVLDGLALEGELNLVPLIHACLMIASTRRCGDWRKWPVPFPT